MPLVTPSPVINYVNTVSDFASTRLRDGQRVSTLGYNSVGDGGENNYIYHRTGRSGITEDGGFFINGPGSDDYFEAINKRELKAEQIGAVGDGSVDDKTKLQNAIDAVVSQKAVLLLGAKTYKVSGKLVGDDYLRIRGAGKYTTTIKCSDITSPIIELIKKSNIHLSDFGITHNALTSDMNNEAGQGIATDSGTGSSTDSQDCIFENLYIHDIPKQGIADYDGHENWEIKGCHFRNLGRAGFVSNGARRTNVHTNFFENTGDDGVALNEESKSNSVHSNIFFRAGSWVAGSAPATAAAIKLHSIGTTVTHNLIESAYRGIYLKASPSTENNPDNYSSASQTIINSNIVRNMQVNKGGAARGALYIDNADRVKVSDNIFDGREGINGGGYTNALYFEDCGSIESTNNSYIGNLRCDASLSVKLFHSKHDHFELVNVGSYWGDRSLFYVDDNANHILVESPTISENCVGFIEAGNGSVINKVEVVSPRIVPPMPIGYIGADITNGVAITSITLRNDSPLSEGALIDITDNFELQIVTYDTTTGALVSEKINVDGAVSQGDTSITIDSFTPSRDYNKDESWIVLSVGDPGDNKRAMLIDAGTTMQELIVKNLENALNYDTRVNQGTGGTINNLRIDKGTVVPGGNISGYPGDWYFKKDTGDLYFKASGGGTTSGWSQVSTV